MSGSPSRLTDAEKEILIDRHRRLVVFIAKTYPAAAGRFAMVIEAGNGGLHGAVDCYEPPTVSPAPSARTYTNMMDGTVVQANEHFEAHAEPFIRAEIERALARG